MEAALGRDQRVEHVVGQDAPDRAAVVVDHHHREAPRLDQLRRHLVADACGRTVTTSSSPSSADIRVSGDVRSASRISSSGHVADQAALLVDDGHRVEVDAVAPGLGRAGRPPSSPCRSTWPCTSAVVMMPPASSSS